ncbi:cytochrome P450 [Cellulomonas sp. SG140]|uniref:cytochrome P450 n=1 Tax=Cellulomonas sp. SG140 TaxID=2976536 RepID=UPI0021E7A04D|nr:cytochrome P450 [Cellulomonas sp. SG140]
MPSDAASSDPSAPARDDWDPRAPEVLDDQVAAYDAMRSRCPVAHSDYLGWSLFRHADVLRVIEDPDTFSSAVSTHLNVPNGMDPPQHTVFRELVDRYFTQELVDGFEAACRRVVRELLESLPARGSSDGAAWDVADFAELFALRAQSAYLGWPDRLHGPLRAWTARNREATLRRDRAAMADVAEDFDGYITQLLDERRALGGAAPRDLTTRLLTERVDGRPLARAELVSIVRNWTVGELSTISASVGIVVHLLATRPQVQQDLRRDPGLIPAAMDELLRVHPPLIANRRVVTAPTELGGHAFEPGDRLTVMWASADRDEAVFGDPDEVRLDRPPQDNLLYGAGIHVCPGAPLARLELRVVTEELLAATGSLEPDPERAPQRAAYPGSGFVSLSVLVR